MLHLGHGELVRQAEARVVHVLVAQPFEGGVVIVVGLREVSQCLEQSNIPHRIGRYVLLVRAWTKTCIDSPAVSIRI